MTEAARDDFSGKRLVVFGAGYVGREVALQGIARAMKVTALTRNAEKAEALRQRGVTTVVADLSSGEWHRQIAPGADFAVSCVSSGGSGIAGYRASYLEGSQSLCRWARQGPRLGTFVYTSSTSVYEQGAGGVVTEDDPAEPQAERPALLREVETLLAREMGAAASRWFIFRLAGIYGPDRHHLLDQLRQGARTVPGMGAHRLNLIHRDDVCAAIWAAFQAHGAVRNEVFNLADDTPSPKAEVIAWLAAKTGAFVPEFDGLATPGRRAVVPDRVIANAKAKAILGWRPRFKSYRDGYNAILGA
jgi:nucleoside-diphosphate-sugar epimerase